MHKRKCSVCHHTGHDKRRHRKKNPEFRTGPGGVIYPLRGTSGWGGHYSRRAAGEKPAKVHRGLLATERRK